MVQQRTAEKRGRLNVVLGDMPHNLSELA
jgi:hypothetical protein